MTEPERQKRRKYLSADLPQPWLLDLSRMALSHRAWALYTHGLMSSIGKTDGLISQDSLPMLLPNDSPANRAGAAAELVQRGLWQWVDEPAGWLYPDWTDHQSTVAQIEHNRETERHKKAKWRASTRESTGDKTGSPPGSTATATATGFKDALRESNHSETLTTEQQRAIVFGGST